MSDVNGSVEAEVKRKGPPSSITIPVTPAEWAMLEGAGEAMNGQRPTQVAKLLLTKGNVDALLHRWHDFVAGE